MADLPITREMRLENKQSTERQFSFHKEIWPGSGERAQKKGDWITQLEQVIPTVRHAINFAVKTKTERGEKKTRSKNCTWKLDDPVIDKRLEIHFYLLVHSDPIPSGEPAH